MLEEIIKAVLIEPEHEPRLITLPDTVYGIQACVKGAYEYCYDAGLELLKTDSVSIYCNECAKITGSQPFNRVLYDSKGNLYDVVFGNLLAVAYDDEGSRISLTDEQTRKIIEHYKLRKEDEHDTYIQATETYKGYPAGDRGLVLWHNKRGRKQVYIGKYEGIQSNAR